MGGELLVSPKRLRGLSPSALKFGSYCRYATVRSRGRILAMRLSIVDDTRASFAEAQRKTSDC